MNDATGRDTPGSAGRLTHLDETGAARMVDVGDKAPTRRRAEAEAFVRMRPETLALVVGGELPKGDVLAVARVAGIMAAKRTSELVPMCHPLALTHVAVEITPIGEPDETGVRIRTVCETVERTGVEMEALTGASVAALTVYDMCKSAERGMSVREVRLLSKVGGASGEWHSEARE